MQQLRTQSGRSMIEMLGVLAIIGVISIGAIAGMNQAMIKYRTSRTYSDILAISQNVSDFYSYKRSYSGLSMAALCGQNEKVFPSKCTDDNKATNAFGGEFLVSAGAEDQMNIKASKLPAGVCAELMALNWGKYVVSSPECSGGADAQTFSIKFY